MELETVFNCRQHANALIESTNPAWTDLSRDWYDCEAADGGNGFDGIDAHWRAKHESVMPYSEAWPLIKSGN
jgi:hypothetical protein